jgi:APA family basic amino acid/polyamine antiporter
MVGVGIMRTPGLVAGAAPNNLVMISLWLAGGAIIAIDAFATIELGASIPRAGGPYAFVSRAFGPFAGSLVGLGDGLNSILGLSMFAVIFGEYLHRLGLLTPIPVTVIGLALIASVTALNLTSTKTSGLSQVVASALKGSALLLLVAALLVSPSVHPHADPRTDHPALTILGLAIAMRAIVSTYAGWNAPVYFAEEVTHPGRTIARSVFGGIAAVVVLYIAVNLVLLKVLTREEIAGSELPVANAAAAVFGSRGGAMATLLALLSIATIANLHPMKMSRLAFALARNGALPERLAVVSRTGVPRVALVFTSLAAAAFALTGSYLALMAIAAPFNLLVPAAADLSAIRMRSREPQLPRPFRMPFYPWPAIVGLVTNLLLLFAIIYEDPRDSLIGIFVVAALALVSARRIRRVHRAPVSV